MIVLFHKACFQQFIIIKRRNSIIYRGSKILSERKPQNAPVVVWLMPLIKGRRFEYRSRAFFEIIIGEH